MAALLAFEPEPIPSTFAPEATGHGGTGGGDFATAPAVALLNPAETAMPFWAVVSYRAEESAFEEIPTYESEEVAMPPPPDVAHADPGYPPLGSFAALLPSLRSAAAPPRACAEPDMRALLRRLGRGVIVEEMPRRRHRRFGRSVVLVEDRSTRLTPYFEDYQRLALADLPSLFPKGAVATALWQSGQPPMPPRGTVVIALSDLGSLDLRSAGALRAWQGYGMALRKAGCHSAAILPGTPSRSVRSLQAFWALSSWSPLGIARLPSRDLLEQLLALAAPAIQIEPGLLRALRLLLVGDGAGPDLEAAFWQSDWLAGRHSSAATLSTEAAARFREAFERLLAGRRTQILSTLGDWHGGMRAVWSEEIAHLGAESQNLLPIEEVEAATCYLADMAVLLDDPLTAPTGLASRFLRMEQRLEASSLTKSEGGQAAEPVRVLRQRMLAAATRVWAGVHRNDGQSPWQGYDLSLLPGAREPQRWITIRQAGDTLLASQAEAATNGGSPVAQMRQRRDMVHVQNDDFWKSGLPPAFAEAWGCDDIGPWFSFSVTGADGAAIAQRLRWIPAGDFLMGSPESEPERSYDEGPQHRVTISRGFWLFDTACTQALWVAVMGENPSLFKGADHPVETVSWDEFQDFIGRLNERVPGLGLRLPSEAQWEYACRAGTDTPFSFGTTISSDQVNFNGNFPYAKGRKGLYRRETVSVGSQPPNRWGLHEMHGNVWEWCADGIREYGPEPVTDPLGPLETGALRVLRGGAWFDDARCCRSASRSAGVPASRAGNFGFRCVRVQDGAEPGETRRIREAERRIAADRSGGAAAQWLRAGSGQQRATLPKGPFILRSDCETVTLAPMTKPSWASAIGRDRFGLWTEFTIPGTEDPPVTQRLRWIAPGRFLMGSPKSEDGRFENEGPQHWVTLSRGFWLGDTVCTQALWRAVRGGNPSHFKGDPMRSVEGVSFDMVRRFFVEIERKIPGLGLSLPTEAQWEYACRAGTDTPYSFGEAISGDQTKFFEASKSASKTVPVASLPPNPWGLHEMHGNVWEWCADAPREYGAAPVTDPLGSLATGAKRVLRGGSWIDVARNCRSARRFADDPGYSAGGIGFRCARVQDGAERGGAAANPAGGAPDRSGAGERSGK